MHLLKRFLTELLLHLTEELLPRQIFLQRETREQILLSHAGLKEALRFQTCKMRVSYLLVFFFIVIFSCTTELAETTYSNKKIPVSIAKNFTMIYTDSMLTKSFVSGKIHYDFTNDLLNYSEFYEDVELVIYDENKTSTISSQYAIVYNSFRFMEFNNNVKITTSDGEVLTTDKLYYDTENEWLFTENNFEYIDKTNKIIANRLDSNRDFTDLVTGNLTGSINITEE